MLNRTKTRRTDNRFSNRLEAWLNSKAPKTLGSINQTFAEKAFAVSILLLMAFPALPLPTGGLSHVFEIVTVILALQLVIGRKTFWLPGFLGRVKLGALTTGKAMPALMKLIRKLEKLSRPRQAALMQTAPIRIISGLIIAGLAITAFLAPPFSGLDTFPSLGVMAITMSIILDDFLIYVIGVVLGASGVVLVFVLGTQAIRFISHLF